MKVALFTDSFRKDMGGGTRLVIDLAKGLKEKGLDLLVVTGKNVDETAEEFNVYRLPSVNYPLYRNAEVILPNKELFQVVKDFNPDVIHYHDPFAAGIIALLLGKQLGKKIVGTIHIHPVHISYYSVRLDNGLMAKMLVGIFSRFTDTLIFVSEYQRRIFGQFLSESVRTEVIYPGIPDYFFKKRAKKGKNRIITVSRLAPEKNLEFALRVMKEVQKKKDVEYIIAGDGDMREKLEEEAKNLGVSVKFLGRLEREKLPEVYESADLFFHPSKTETFGLVFAEAMAVGLPVVCLNYGSAPEVVNGGGIICEEDVRSVSEAILSLLGDDSLWLEKSEKARQVAKKRYNSERFIESHIRIYLS
ncbi:glycosyltransferase [Aquifex pyrophilus]